MIDKGKRFAIAALATACAVMVGARGVDSQTPTPTPVSLVITGQQGAVATVFYYAIEQGIFKRHGIDLKISAPTNASTTSDVVYVAQGQYDMGAVGGPAAMVYRQKYGGDVVVFYGYIQNNPRCLVVGQDSGINSIGGLKGKKIGAPSNSPDADIAAYLSRKGLGPDDYTLVPLSNSAVNSAFISGKVDAIVSYDENMPIFNDAGKKSKAFCLRYDGLNYQQVDIATTQTFIKTHRGVVSAFAAALTEAIDAAKADPGQASGAVYRANLAQKPLGAEVPAQQFHYVVSYYKTPNDAGHGYGWMSPKDWSETQDVAVKFFGLEPGLNFSSGWTDEFVR